MIQFTQRPKLMPIGYIQPASTGPVQWIFPIEDARSVMLIFEDKQVMVDKIEKQPDGTYKGFVDSIEPPGSQIDGLKDGDEVVFTEDEVVAASK